MRSRVSGGGDLLKDLKSGWTKGFVTGDPCPFQELGLLGQSYTPIPAGFLRLVKNLLLVNRNHVQPFCTLTQSFRSRVGVT